MRILRFVTKKMLFLNKTRNNSSYFCKEMSNYRLPFVEYKNDFTFGTIPLSLGLNIKRTEQINEHRGRHFQYTIETRNGLTDDW